MRVIVALMARRIRRDETGAVLVLVAIFMTVALGIAALAIDLGNAWQEQRHLHVATDAAALAAAQTYAQGTAGCPSPASSYVTSNDGRATMTACTGVPFGSASSSGYVTVKAKATVHYHFAEIFGLSSNDDHSSTTARWGSPTGVSGARPLTLCLYYPGLASWLNLPAGPTGPSAPIKVPFTNSFTGCNSTSSWGWLDFTGSAGAADVHDWLAHGYPGLVSVPSTVQTETGHISSVAPYLADLVASGETFPITMFDTVAGTGSNTYYHVIAIAMVKLLAYKVNGNQSQQYFTFQFLRGTLSGTCCGTGPSTGTYVTAICAVNADPRTGECGL